MRLLRAFYERYAYRLDLMNQPSEQTLGILLNAHQRKSDEFAPLSKVSNAMGHRDVRIDPSRIKCTPRLIGPQGQNGEIETTYNLPPVSFAHSVRVLLLGYVLVSANDNRKTSGVHWKLRCTILMWRNAIPGWAVSQITRYTDGLCKLKCPSGRSGRGRSDTSRISHVAMQLP